MKSNCTNIVRNSGTCRHPARRPKTPSARISQPQQQRQTRPLRPFCRQLGGRKSLGNPWKWAGWLWEWLENLPNLGATTLSRREQAQTTELWVLQCPQKPTLKKKARPELCGSLQQRASGCCTDQSGQASRSRSDLQRTDLSRHKQSHCLRKPCSTLRNAEKV